MVSPEEGRMHLDRRLLGWGIFFILLGVVPLAVRAGYVDADLVGRWPTLWPILLIGGGLGLILRATSVSWLGGAITAITLGVMGGSAIATGFGGIPSFSGCGGGAGQAFAAQHGALTGSGRVNVEFNCGNLTIATTDASEWQVTGTDQRGHGPTVNVAQDGTVTLKGGARNLFDDLGRSTWAVALPKTFDRAGAPGLDLGVTLNAGDGSMSLAGATIDALSLTVNAGSMAVDLTTAQAMPRGGLSATVNAGKATLSLPAFDGSASLSLNAGNLVVCVPTGTALLVHWNGTVASNDLAEAGLTQSGNDRTWVTPGFVATAPHVELSVSANAGSFDLNLGGSCSG
jgi:hypothetical protein